MAAKKSTNVQNTRDLRQMLIETIEQVRAGTLDAKQARTIAALSSTVLQSAKLDLDFMRFRVQQEAASESPSDSLRLVSSETVQTVQSPVVKRG